jgi:imidazolonepropionase-like amidohydrolase
MRALKLLACGVVVMSVGSMAVFTQSRNASGPVVYEGARLIIGTDTAPIENGSFVVEHGRITAVGAKGSVRVPGGATRVDLTGKTVMPAIVNLHSHIGYEKFITAAGESRPENHTAENIHDHLQRQAFYGVGTVNDAGSVSLDIAKQYLIDRDARKFSSDAARFNLMAGVVPVNGGPDHILIKATRPLHANFEVTLAPEARAAVQQIAAKGVKHLKIWIGDRRGSYPAMPHETYDATIEEAHKLGILVHAHAGSNRDQIDALKAGVDLLVHTIQNEKLSDELVGLLQQKKPYWTPVMGLGDRSDLCDPDPFSEQVQSARTIADVRQSNCKPSPNAATREEMLKHNFKKMIDSGARLVLGTDAGVFPRYSFGWADHHEMGRYVQLGITPAQAIVASTSRPAEALGLKDVGVLGEGKVADFLVLNANPLEDIRNTRQISAVYLGGTKLDRDAMLARWKQSQTSE